MLTELFLITEEESKRFYKTLKGGHLLVRDDVEVAKAKPVFLKFNYEDYYRGINPTIQVDSREFPFVANALLLGNPLEEQDAVYYPASYCRIKSLS